MRRAWPDRRLAAPRRAVLFATSYMAATAGSWRAASDGPKKRGRKASQGAKDVEIVALRRENERLQRQLAQAELIIGVQKKLAEALEQTLTEGES